MASARVRWELPFARFYRRVGAQGGWPRLIALGALGLSLGAGAWAAEGPASLPQEGWVAIVPPASPVVAGEPARIQVLAVDGEGAPLEGLRLRPEASGAEASGWEAVGPGLYAFDLRVDAAQPPGEIELSLQGRIPRRDPVREGVTVPVLPALKMPSAVARPDPLILGRTDGGTLIFDDAGELIFREVAGAVRNLTDMGDRKTARFEAPTVNFPHLAMITFADRARPLDAWGHVTIRLQGSVEFPVQGPAGASVLLKVAEAEFGPEVMDAQGAARVPIVVPPGVDEAIQVNVIDGETDEATLALGIPETRRLALFPLPETIPAGASAPIPLRAVIRTVAGDADVGAKPRFEASAGKVGPVRHLGAGIFEASWTPPVGSTPEPVEIAVALDSEVQRDALQVQVAPARPEALQIEAQADGRVRIQALGADGPLSDEDLVVRVVGATVKADEAEGAARLLTLEPSKEGPVRIDAHLRPAPSTNPLAQVLVLPASRWIVNDGASDTTVVIATVDAFGYPVPDTEVALELIGGGELEGRVVTDARGTAQLPYVAGQGAGLVRITARSGEAVGEGWLVSSPEPWAGELPTPQGVAGDWARLVASHTVGAPDSAPAVAAGSAAEPSAAEEPSEPSLAAASTPLSSLEITLEPERARPGDPVQVRVTPRSAEGLAIPGQGLDFLTSMGRFTEIHEVDGTWSAILALPEEAAGEVKVSVVAPDGTLQMMAITVDPAAPPAVLAKPVAPVVPRPAAREAPERPWLRARLSGVGSLYNYEQAPTDEPGPLLPRPLVVGGPSGSPATPMGGELDFRGWLPSFPYLGLHAMGRSTRYAVDATDLGGLARDTLVNAQLSLTGRYPFQIGADSYWIGASVGVQYSDFMLYTGCLEPGCTVGYEHLGLTGLALGPELGAEIDRLFLIAGYTLGMAGVDQPYSHAVDVHLGYQITRRVFADLGLTSLTRSIAIRGAQSRLQRGQLGDHQMIFTLGGGISL